MRYTLFSLAKVYCFILAALIFLAFHFSACSEDESTSPPPPPSDPNSVSIQSSSFNPSTRTVSVGTTITWTNNNGIAHTVTSSGGSGPLNSGNIPPGGTFQFTFTQAGTFNYFCQIHPAMTGQIIVQ